MLIQLYWLNFYETFYPIGNSLNWVWKINKMYRKIVCYLILSKIKNLHLWFLLGYIILNIRKWVRSIPLGSQFYSNSLTMKGGSYSISLWGEKLCNSCRRVLWCFVMYKKSLHCRSDALNLFCKLCNFFIIGSISCQSFLYKLLMSCSLISAGSLKIY